MKLLFLTPDGMLRDLDDAFPPGSNPTDEQIEEIIHANDWCEWDVEDIKLPIHSAFELIHLLNQAQNYDNYAILDGSEPYYKYFTGETK
jgi:hypothetical protein